MKNITTENLRETTETIGQWARDTLGPSPSNLRKAIRANNEMAELLTRLVLDDNDPAAVDEAVDICIVLHTVAWQMGKDLDERVQAKMKINREREWVLDGSGCGQHK